MPQNNISGYRIMAMTPPGIAPEDSPDRKPESPERTMLFDGFNAVCGTGWMIAAGRGKKGGNEILVKPDQSDQYQANTAFQSFVQENECFEQCVFQCPCN